MIFLAGQKYPETLNRMLPMSGHFDKKDETADLY